MSLHFVYLGYNEDGFPFGRLEIESLSDEYLASSALVPAIKHDQDGSNVEVMYWALIPRTRVDTKPEPRLGETSAH